MEIWYKINLTLLVVSACCLIVIKLSEFDDWPKIAALAILTPILITPPSWVIYYLFRIWSR